MEWAIRVLACFVCLLFQPMIAVSQTDSPTSGNERTLIRVESAGGNQRYVEFVRGHATAALRALNQKTGDALLVPITFVVAENDNRFNELTGGGSEHSLAVAFGEDQKVIINYQLMAQSGADKIRQVLIHELAHVYLDVKCQARVPHWVHEGVAQEIAGEWTLAPGDARLAIAAYTGGLIPLDDLVHGFPANASQRDQAYAEAYSAIRFLVREDYGNSLFAFLATLRGSQGTETLKALSDGVELDALELRWRDDLRSPLFALSILVSSGFFWGLAAVLVLFAYAYKRRRSKLIRQQWAREEAIVAEYESIHDRIDQFDADLEAQLIEGDEPAAAYEPEETPFDRYLAERENDERY